MEKLNPTDTRVQSKEISEVRVHRSSSRPEQAISDSMLSNGGEMDLTSLDDLTLEDIAWNLMEKTGFLSDLKCRMLKFIELNGNLRDEEITVMPERANPFVLERIYEYLNWMGMKNTCAALLTEAPLPLDPHETDPNAVPVLLKWYEMNGAKTSKTVLDATFEIQKKSVTEVESSKRYRELLKVDESDVESYANSFEEEKESSVTSPPSSHRLFKRNDAEHDSNLTDGNSEKPDRSQGKFENLDKPSNPANNNFETNANGSGSEKDDILSSVVEDSSLLSDFSIDLNTEDISIDSKTNGIATADHVIHLNINLTDINTMSVHAMADWHELGSGSGQFFRKTELYLMGWNSDRITIDLTNYTLIGAPYGGPLGIIRDDKKFTRVTPSAPVKPIISIFNASGSLFGTIKWDSGVLIKMGWSSAEDLICIQEDGNLYVYSLFGQHCDTVHCFGGQGLRYKVYEAEIFPSTTGTGVAFLTTENNPVFIVVNDYKVGMTKKFANLPGDGKLLAWSVFSGKEAKIIASRDSSVYLLDRETCEEVRIEFLYDKNPMIIMIAVSLNGEHVALYTKAGVLWLGSSNLKETYLELSTTISIKPKQIVWCGKEAVLLSWEKVLLLVDRDGRKLNFPIESEFYLIPEIDSVRLVTNFTHEIIQKIPEDSRLIFGIGSLAPGSWLLEAYKEYTQKTSKADEYVRCIANMEEAVRQCVDAAAYEFHPQSQKLLLRAALFGKTWLTKYNPEKYLHVCQFLRILNSVKDYKFGIPLTYTQLEHMTPSVLIDRLLLRKHYALAMEIATFLRLPDSIGKSRILGHWACNKVEQTHVESKRLAAEIYGKLKSDAGISYSEIAEKAFRLGRRELALNLAQHEIRKEIQVGLFLKLDDTKTALEKAVESGDSNLIYSCLFKVREQMSLPDFQMCVRAFPIAYALYISYLKFSNPEAARRMFEIEDDFPSQAEFFINESDLDKRFESRLSSLQSAAHHYAKAERVPLSKEHRKGKYEFMALACEDRIKLLKEQKALEAKFGDPYLNCSVRETIQRLLIKGEVKVAEKIRGDFKVPDRVFWLIRLNCLGEARNWTELEKLSKPKKIPGGYEDFVEVCLQYGSKDEALKYLPKVKEDLQAKFYVEAGCLEKAAEIAFAQKDEGMLVHTLSQCSNNEQELATRIQVMIESVRTANQGSSIRIW